MKPRASGAASAAGPVPAARVFQDEAVVEKALLGLVGRSAPGSPEEAGNIRVLRHHPFFKLWGLRELDGRELTYHRGEIRTPLGRHFTPDAFGRLQSIFESALEMLRSSPPGSLEAKLQSLARFKEISNLRVEAIAQVLGEAAWSCFRRARGEYLAESYPRQLTLTLTYQCNRKCEYCFSRELAEKQPGHLSEELFERVVGWMGGKGFKRISLFGGEPTIHPQFTRFLRRLADLGYDVYFASNGLYSDQVAEGLDCPRLLSITFDIPATGTCSEENVRRLRANLRRLPAHVKAVYRFTLAGEHRDLGLLRELIDEVRPEALSFAIAFPSEGRTNNFVDQDNFSSFGRDLVELTRIGSEKQILTVMAKPLPFCRIAEPELAAILEGVDRFNGCDIYQDNFTQLATLSPTGVFYPCIALPQFARLRFDETLTLEDIGRYNRSVVDGLLGAPVLAECPGCNLFKSRLCQGFCYAHYAKRSV